jgi:RNA polymerase sigma factor (sigma-70 family)
MNAEQESLITENVSIIGRVVAREMALGVMPWVDRSDLEDVGNLALVKAARDWRGPDDGRRCLKRRLLQAGDGTFAAFAYTSVHNAVLMEIRAMRVRNGNRVEMPENEEESHTITGSDFQLHEALKALDPVEYRVITLKYWADKTQSEIADGMGVDQATVSRILRNARKVLKSCINSNSQAPIQVRGEREQKGVGHPRGSIARLCLPIGKGLPVPRLCA